MRLEWNGRKRKEKEIENRNSWQGDLDTYIFVIDADIGLSYMCRSIIRGHRCVSRMLRDYIILLSLVKA